MSTRLDSRALRLFLAVARTLSFRQAAEALHLSQPPLSRAIRELEARLGVLLFERDTQGVALTAAGRALVPFARRTERLLDDAEAALAGLRAPAPAALRLGLTTAVETSGLRRLLAPIEAAHPGAVVSQSDSSPRLVRQILAGRLDAALVAMPVAAPGLELLPLESQPLVAALPSTHRLARKRRLALADLEGEPVFWFERARQPLFHDHCQRVFDARGFAPRLLREPADHHVLLAEVAAGRGLALLPDSFTQLRRAGVAYRPLAEGGELAVGIGLATPADRPALRDTLRAALGGPPREAYAARARSARR
jgi:DNA-binding transcriptional LysR family regulator